MRKLKKNKLSRAMFLMQKAAQKFPEELTTSSQRQLLEVIKKSYGWTSLSLSQFLVFCVIKTWITPSNKKKKNGRNLRDIGCF